MLLLNGQPLLQASRASAACIVSRLCKNRYAQGQVDAYLKQRTLPPPACKTVHVLQGEMASICIAQETERISICSSEATTCCILALSCRQSGRHSIAHFDRRAGQVQCLPRMLRGMETPDLYIVGGYSEPTNCGIDTANELLTLLEELELPVEVKLACIGPLNTAPDAAPKCCSLALLVDGGEPFVAPCVEHVNRGPQLTGRLAHNWVISDPALRNIYDRRSSGLRISQCNARLSQQQMEIYISALQLPDSHFLRWSSTSPQHEAPHFVPDCKAVLRWLIDNNDRTITHDSNASINRSENSKHSKSYIWSQGWQPLLNV